MTGLLTDLLHDKADSLPTTTFDTHQIVRDGHRRVARRRLGVVAMGAAAAVIAGFAIPAMLPSNGGGPDNSVTRLSDSPFAGAFADHQPTYAVGSVVHIDGRSFDVGTKISAFVATDVGVVYSDIHGTVWAADGVDVTEVGMVDWKEPRLEADGSLVAWVEPEQGQNLSLAALDQATGEVFREDLRNQTNTSLVDDLLAYAEVFAVDQDSVYLRDVGGFVRWNIRTDSRTLVPLEVHVSNITGIIDAQADVLVYAQSPGDDVPDGPDRRTRFVARTNSSAERELHLDAAYSLSPDGRFLLGERLDNEIVDVIDVQSGDVMSVDAPAYDYLAGYAWLGDNMYAAFGVNEPYETTPLDILLCEVGNECEVVDQAVGNLTSDSFVLPDGRYERY